MIAATPNGLLIAGELVPIPGLTIIPPASHVGPAWATLDPGDYTTRSTGWIRQVLIHTTGGHWPQPILTGAGPAGHAKQIADMWRGADRGDGKRVHSAAQLIVDYDGTVVCLCDLATNAAYHAEGSNPWSIGIEMCTLPNGAIYEATLAATVPLALALCERFAIPAQMPDRYHGEPLMRMEMGAGAARRNRGGPDCVGIFGHRHNTGERGRGDPGDEVFARLAIAGVEALDYDGLQDLALGRGRQRTLNGRGEHLVVDGQVGPASVTAARRQGYARWRDVPMA